MRTAHAHVPVIAATSQEPAVAHASGYGVFLGTVAGRPARFHAGDNPGYTSLLAWLSDEDIDIAVLANDDGSPLDAPIRHAVTGVAAADRS
jgi:hypothetical protein